MSRLTALFALFACVAAVALASAWSARPASACSRAGFSAEVVGSTVAESKVVAIGTFTGATARAATFRIDEALKGPASGTELRIDNRTSYTYSACSPYDEPFDKGGRFAKGDQRIVMLSKEVDGLCQVSYFSDTAWSIPSDELQPLITDFWNDGTRPPALDVVRAQIQAEKSKLGTDLGWESRTPCNPDSDLGVKIASSTAVVIGDVEPSEEGGKVRVREVLAGSPPPTFTLNTSVRRDYTTCDLVQDQFSRAQPGRFLLYIRPDEAGTADYRLAFWGSARNEVNEKYVTEGLPTLRDIREAVGQSKVTSLAPEIGSSRPAWPYFALIAGVVGLTLGAVLWRRSTTRSPH